MNLQNIMALKFHRIKPVTEDSDFQNGAVPKVCGI
jgi:hypothetical protein